MIFATPIPLATYAQLVVLVVVISLVYSATRYDSLGAILHEAFRWGSRMALFLAVIAGILYLVAINT